MSLANSATPPKNAPLLNGFPKCPSGRENAGFGADFAGPLLDGYFPSRLVESCSTGRRISALPYLAACSLRASRLVVIASG
jgi:hypothetical protein